ncbi:MAG: hypothetical protein GX299_03895 [Epulopiscium sp.]|jgi:hypothetical protein|nr:hypothetical protein [Lachnospiraceae bacterium]NLK37209.1 hypothetical protein [Candidatus Epulonipiscium sp.]
MSYDINICYHSRANKYLKKLSQNERNKTMLLISEKVRGYIEDGDRRYIFQEKYFSKLGQFDSTVYYLKINLKVIAILSIDEDPIFGKVVVNIFTLCSHEKMNIEIHGIMESLYQKMINEESYDEEEE